MSLLQTSVERPSNRRSTLIWQRACQTNPADFSRKKYFLFFWKVGRIGCLQAIFDVAPASSLCRKRIHPALSFYAVFMQLRIDGKNPVATAPSSDKNRPTPSAEAAAILLFQGGELLYP
jgi:hypothetical protein